MELAHLLYQDRAYDESLKLCDAVLRSLPEHPPAHLQRAETLLALGRYADAGQALDRYLAKGPPQMEVYRAFGLIQAWQRKFPEAVEAYNKALTLKPDAATRRYRGWLYLRLEAPRSGAGRLRGGIAAGASIGRCVERTGTSEGASGNLRPRRGRRGGSGQEGATIGAPAIQRGLHLRHRRGPTGIPTAEHSQPSADRYRFQERALDLLRLAITELPPEERSAFWRDNVRTEPVLARLGHSADMQQLARLYDNEPRR